MEAEFSTNVDVAEGSLAECVMTAASRRPDSIAFISGSEKRGWKEVERRMIAYAAGLAAAGFGSGSRIAIVAGVSMPHVELTMGLSYAGVTAVPINTRLAPAEMIDIVRRADVAAMAFDAQGGALAATIAEACGGLPLIDIESIPDFGARPTAPAKWAPDALATLLFTGGTTGIPKGVLLTAGNLLVHGANVRNCLRYDADTVVLHGQPIFHVAGLNQLYATVMGAGCLVFRPDGGLAATYEELASNGVNSIGVVPTTLGLLLDFPGRDDRLLARIRSVVYGAAPISEALLSRALTAMPNAKFTQFYGQTETGAVTALLPAYHVLEGRNAGKLRTVGIPRPHLEIAIGNEAGEPLPAGSVGEILVRGRGLTPGYWRSPEETARLYVNGWLRTGDAGVIDGDGFISIVDRYKDMIVTGGENVFSIEVENVLSTHPDVVQCAVYGVPDEHWGEIVEAAIVPRAGATLSDADLIEYSRQRIARYKTPKSIRFHPEGLPLNGVGKVLKHVLRDRSRQERELSGHKALP